MSLILLALLLFLTVSALGIAIVGQILMRLPETYFSESHSHEFWSGAHPVLRWTGLVLKNILGVGVLFLGVVLTLPGVPGPGILTILLGIMLMDFPGKRRLERWMIRRPKVLDAINRMRLRNGKQPFVL